VTACARSFRDAPAFGNFDRSGVYGPQLVTGSGFDPRGLRGRSERISGDDCANGKNLHAALSAQGGKRRVNHHNNASGATTSSAAVSKPSFPKSST